MSTTNRATIITKLQKVVKKHYKPVPAVERNVLEHILYACCVQNSKFEAADEAFAKLQAQYFEWNEVRVTTVSELADVMNGLADPPIAAKRLKSCLQSIFEEHYSFDVDFLKKQNLGKTVKDLTRLDGFSDFIVSYVTQHGLGGHAIPLNHGALQAFYVVGAISDKEIRKHKVPGLERAIAKTKGVEVASLIHQLGVDFYSTPHSPKVRNLLLEIAPDAKQRFPKRAAKKAPTKAKQTKTAAKKTTAKPKAKSAKEKTESPTKKTAKKKTATKKKSPTKRLSKKKPK